MSNKIVSISSGMYSMGGNEKETKRLFALTEDGDLYVLTSKVVSSDPFANFPIKNYWKPVLGVSDDG